MSLVTKIFFFTALFFPLCSYSYIGPGVSGGLLATILGIVFAIFILIVGIIYYPLKRLIKKFGKKRLKKIKTR